jgi:hypothetical protein
MGFYLRKSIKAGPFRFNLSKSGMGVSVGVPGFRVGTGPRGNYVHVGRGGLYYRATLPGDGAPPHERGRRPPSSPHDFRVIESGDVRQMTDSSASALLQQVKVAASRPRYALAVAGAAGVAGLYFTATQQPAVALVIWAIGALATLWVHWGDEAARSVVLFYELEPEADSAYEDLHHAFRRMCETDAAWNVQAQADVADGRRHAGVNTVVQRARIRLSIGTPAVIRTNVAVPSIPCGAETLYFFPDRLLVSSPQGTGAIGYDQLRIAVDTTRFVESGPVPPDGMVIGTSWQYQNRDGSPDRRFANNQELPTLLYEEIEFSSASGLHEILQLSRTGSGEAFRSAVAALAGC